MDDLPRWTFRVPLAYSYVEAPMDDSGKADQPSFVDITPLRRRLVRLNLFLGAVLVVVGWGLLAVYNGTGRVLGWSLFAWMYGWLVLVGMVGMVVWYRFWRCPECLRYLGNVFNLRFCHRCGVKLRP
jgi:hypothetical protein